MNFRDQDKSNGFLSRWSRRKQAAEQQAEAEAGAPALKSEETLADTGSADRELSENGAAVDVAPGEAAAFDLKSLPDIDSLNEKSDFSVFLQSGVPDALRRRALRKLWRVDPAFNEICMLDDYNLDYTDAAMVVPNLKTIYQVGKGMVLPEEEEAEAAALEEQEKLRLERSELERTETGGEDSADTGDSPQEVVTTAGQDQATAEAVPGADEETSSDMNAAYTRARKPGDAIVAAATTRRRPVRKAAERSAQHRRWGDSDI